MIVLNNDEVVGDVALADVVSIERKTGIQDAFKILEVQPKGRLSKKELATEYEAYVKMHPEEALQSIPPSELDLLYELVHSEQHQYVECSARDVTLYIQDLFFVVTYVDGDTWHLYMYDSVRNILKAGLDKITVDNPEYKEACEIFNQYGEIARKTMELIAGEDPSNLSITKMKYLYNQLTALRNELDGLIDRMKKINNALEEKMFFNVTPWLEEMEEVSMHLLVAAMPISDTSLFEEN